MFVSNPNSSTVSVDEIMSANESNKTDANTENNADTDSSNNSNNADSDDDSRITAATTEEALSFGVNSVNSVSSNNNHQQQQQQKRQKKEMPPSKYVTESQRRSVQFPWKLHEMLDDVEECGHTDIIHWLPSGDAFYVRDCKRFVDEIMPLYFSQKFYKSFQRQLNMWGFSKVRQGPNKGAIGNEFFQRNQPDLCCSMKRIKIKGCGKFRKQSLPLTGNAIHSDSHATDAANRRSAVDIVMCSDALYSDTNNTNTDQRPSTSSSSSSQQPAPVMDNGIAMALLAALQQASAVQHQQQVPALQHASIDDQSMTVALTLLIQQQQQEIAARQQQQQEETKRSVLLASLMLGNTPAPPNTAALMALLRLAQNHSSTM